MKNQDVYDMVNKRILELMESGEFSWHKPWKGDGQPCNLETKRPYRGINTWTLGYTEFSSPYWLTYKQARKFGGHVRKGEKSNTVVFWKPLRNVKVTNDDGDDERKNVLLLKYYRVFNAEQCDGIDHKIPVVEVNDNDPLAECEKVWEGYGDKPELVFNNPGRAFYKPSVDTINMPKLEQFDGSEEYYSTLFHESIHSTGHKDRLNRLKPDFFGGQDYSREELVAEMGAAFLCGVTGINNKTEHNSAAYLQSWAKELRNDRRLFVNAAAQAQKASDWILGKEQNNGETYTDETADAGSNKKKEGEPVAC